MMGRSDSRGWDLGSLYLTQGLRWELKSVVRRGKARRQKIDASVVTTVVGGSRQYSYFNPLYTFHEP